MLEFLMMVAGMSDSQLIEYAEKFGLTPRPEDSGGEEISNFRLRVIYALMPEG